MTWIEPFDSSDPLKEGLLSPYNIFGRRLLLFSGSSCFHRLFHNPLKEKTRNPPTNTRDVSRIPGNWITLGTQLPCIKRSVTGELSTADDHIYNSRDVPLRVEEEFQIPVHWTSVSQMKTWASLVWSCGQQWMPTEKHKNRESTYLYFSEILPQAAATAKHSSILI